MKSISIEFLKFIMSTCHFICKYVHAISFIKCMVFFFIIKYLTNTLSKKKKKIINSNNFIIIIYLLTQSGNFIILHCKVNKGYIKDNK